MAFTGVLDSGRTLNEGSPQDWANPSRASVFDGGHLKAAVVGMTGPGFSSWSQANGENQENCCSSHWSHCHMSHFCFYLHNGILTVMSMYVFILIMSPVCPADPEHLMCFSFLVSRCWRGIG